MAHVSQLKLKKDTLSQNVSVVALAVFDNSF